FDFEENYGELGKEFIEVHHIIPLSQIRREYIINPEKDLIPLCSNCHSMIHRRGGEAIPIKEFKKIYDQLHSL
ncbi:MAG: HNH endonuclease, partial [Bacteroidaceae bacterium]|nr:HNH endonuclease [Bacteroidaceae bacterium]